MANAVPGLSAYLQSSNLGSWVRSAVYSSTNAFRRSYAESSELEPCSICLVDQTDQNASTRTKCNHVFHTSCLTRWAQVKPTCPFCRAELNNWLTRWVFQLKNSTHELGLTIFQYLFDLPPVDEPQPTQIDAAALGIFFSHYCTEGDAARVIEMIESPRFAEIDPERFAEGFEFASLSGHLGVVNALIASPRFDELNIEQLGRSLYYASQRGHLSIVKAFIAQPRSAEIPLRFIMAALDRVEAGTNIAKVLRAHFKNGL